MKKPATIQYTVRNVPADLDQLLRKRASESGKSLNEVVVETLYRGVGKPRRRRDLSHIAGSMSAEDHAILQQILREQDTIDPELWQ